MRFPHCYAGWTYLQNTAKLQFYRKQILITFLHISQTVQSGFANIIALYKFLNPRRSINLNALYSTNVSQFTVNVDQELNISRPSNSQLLARVNVYRLPCLQKMLHLVLDLWCQKLNVCDSLR